MWAFSTLLIVELVYCITELSLAAMRLIIFLLSRHFQGSSGRALYHFVIFIEHGKEKVRGNAMDLGGIFLDTDRIISVVNDILHNTH